MVPGLRTQAAKPRKPMAAGVIARIIRSARCQRASPVSEIHATHASCVRDDSSPISIGPWVAGTARSKTPVLSEKPFASKSLRFFRSLLCRHPSEHPLTAISPAPSLRLRASARHPPTQPRPSLPCHSLPQPPTLRRNNSFPGIQRNSPVPAFPAAAVSGRHNTP